MPSVAYILKSGIILGILYLYYYFFLRKQTFFTLNRFYLLGAILWATAIPFVHISLHIDKNLPALPVFSPEFFQNAGALSVIPQPETREPAIYTWLMFIYWTGVCFFTIKYLIFWIKVLRLCKKYPGKKYKKICFIFLQHPYPTFSVFNRLFINVQDLDRAGRQKVFEHEKIHIRQLHSLDIHLTGLLCIFNWFNPLIWIYQKTILQNHEYIADQQVVKRYQTGSYLQLLVGETLKGKYAFSNGFSCSNLKKRMLMMTKKQTCKYRVWSYIPALLLSGILFLSFNCVITGKPAVANPSVLLPVTFPAPVTPDQDTVFNVVEKMPAFKGNLQQWLQTHLKTPQGLTENVKVFVKYVVDKNGKVTNVELARGSSSEAANTEALRAVKSMPDWTPGIQRGQTVAVRYVLPISFTAGNKTTGSEQEPVVIGMTKKADTSTPAENEVFNVVEIMPQFKGNLTEWLIQHIQVPDDVKNSSEPVKVYVKFTVGKDGNIKDVELARGSSFKSADEEALRLVKSMPAWEAGQQRGQKVNVKYVLPISFK